MTEKNIAIGFEGSVLLGLPPVDVLFTNNTLAVGYESVTYSWDFGDGETSTDVSPQHSYTIPGEYTVRLTVTADGEVFEETKTRYIYVVGTNVVLPSDVLIDEEIVEVANGEYARVRHYRGKNEYGGELIKEVIIPIEESGGGLVPTTEERLVALEDAVMTLMGV